MNFILKRNKLLFIPIHFFFHIFWFFFCSTTQPATPTLSTIRCFLGFGELRSSRKLRTKRSAQTQETKNTRRIVVTRWHTAKMKKTNCKSFVWVNDSVYACRLRTMGTQKDAPTQPHHSHSHLYSILFCNYDMTWDLRAMWANRDYCIQHKCDIWFQTFASHEWKWTLVLVLSRDETERRECALCS